jgi:hypothetical protein
MPIRYLVTSSITLAGAIAPAYAAEQNLGSYYWIENCKSLVTGRITVEKTSGPSGVRLTTRAGRVPATRQNCPSPVPGVWVVARGSGAGNVSFVMHYPTGNGPKTSSHSKDVNLR